MHRDSLAIRLVSYYYHHPLINRTVNPAEILPVSGIPKLVIAKCDAD